MGTSGTFVAFSVTALTEGGPALLATLIVVSSLFQFVLGSRLVLRRHYATSVSHRQYHDTDVVTVRVDADKGA